MRQLGRRRWSLALGLGLGLLRAPALAHLPLIHPHFVDLVQRSELILMGTVTHATPVTPRQYDVVAKTHLVLVGKFAGKQVTFRSPPGLAAGERYVFFLHRGSNGWDSLAESGTIFPSSAADDALYRSTIVKVAAALRSDAAARSAALRAALIPALSAAAGPLRYEAALELRVLAHDGHGPTEAERRHISQLLASSAADPALRPLLSSFIETPPPTPAPTPPATR